MFNIELIKKLNRLIEIEKEAFYFAQDVNDELSAATAIGAMTAYACILQEVKDQEQKKWNSLFSNESVI